MKKLTATITALALLTSAAASLPVMAAEESADQVFTSSPTSEELYAPVLAAVKNRLQEGVAEHPEDSSLSGVLLNNPAPFSYLWYRDETLTATNTGYAITDLNGDDRDELVIGTIDADGNGKIFDLYTQFGGELYHIAAAGERLFFDVTDRGLIVEEGSHNAATSVTIFHEIGKDRLVPYDGFMTDRDANVTSKLDSVTISEDGSGYIYAWKETDEPADDFKYQSIRFTAFTEIINPGVSDYIAEYAKYLVEQDYKAKTGTDAAASEAVLSNNGAVATVTLSDADGNVLDVYTVDVQTGIGRNNAGEEVDLTVYHKEPDESKFFVELQYMSIVAKKYYMAQHGFASVFSEMQREPGTGEVTIILFDENRKVIASYTIDATTGIGTDSEGNAVDMSGYAGFKPGTEPDLFVPLDILDDVAEGYFQEKSKKNGIDAQIETDLDIPMAIISLCDETDAALDVYTIDLVTGTGKDSSGNTVDLAAYARAHEVKDADQESEYFTSLDEMGRMAVIDYEKKTGKAAYCSNITESTANGEKVISITLTNADGKEIDVYTISPFNGTGMNTAGESVDLPQTGNNAPGTAAAATGGLLMMISGMYAVMRSGVLRRKDKKHTR